MKLESESIFFKSTLCDKPSYKAKASELNNDALDSETFKIENEENHEQISCDLNGGGNLDNHLQCTSKDDNGWNPFKEDSSSVDSSDNDDVTAVNVESFEKDSELYTETLKIENKENHEQISCDLNGGGNLENLDNHSQRTSKDDNGWNPFKEDSSSIDSSDNDDVTAVNVESFEKDSELYTEENVPECDLPKLIICFEESSCNIIKDICIDERINPCTSPVKVVFESVEDEDDQNDVLVKELEFTDITMADEFKISDESLSEKDSIDQTDLNELIPSMVVDCDENDSNKKPNLELEPGNCNDNDAVEEHSVEMSSEIENCSNPSSVPACEESENVPEKSTSMDPGPKDNSVTNDSSSNGKIEKEALTFNLDECCEKGVDHNEIIRTEPGKLSVVEVTPSSQIQLGVGESSFSSAAPLASLINYSGPVAYSGNLSIRSDSSTMSTRSFAFPILQTEWHHNSPVRMAEADRRFFRKHKGWRQGLFCCRF